VAPAFTTYGACPTSGRFDSVDPAPTFSRSISLRMMVTFENTVMGASRSANDPSPLWISSSTP
jgi:hypothetical protein